MLYWIRQSGYYRVLYEWVFLLLNKTLFSHNKLKKSHNYFQFIKLVKNMHSSFIWINIENWQSYLMFQNNWSWTNKDYSIGSTMFIQRLTLKTIHLQIWKYNILCTQNQQNHVETNLKSLKK